METFILWSVLYAGTSKEEWAQQTTFPLSINLCMDKKRDLDIWRRRNPEQFRDPEIQFVCQPAQWRPR